MGGSVISERAVRFLGIGQLGSCGKPLLNKATDNCTESDLQLDFALLKHCKAFIGVESCSLTLRPHLAFQELYCSDRRSPMTWGHATNINISSRKRCSPCIDLIAYDKCPYGIACMESITVEGVEAALRTQFIDVNKAGLDRLAAELLACKIGFG
jgi:hypothetical protein